MTGKFSTIDHIEFVETNPEQYEQKYVHDAYNNVAHSFSHTRHTPWAKIKEYLSNIPLNNILLDVGCGNGKNLGIFKGESYGCDTCQELLTIAKKKCDNVKISNILNLDYDDNFANNVICISVLHHLASKERRLQAIKELIRVCKNGGEILIYVWAKQEKEAEQMVSFQHNGIDLNRYYHLFEKDELIELCSINIVQILDVYFDKENWAILLRKNEIKKRISFSKKLEVAKTDAIFYKTEITN
jgi:ubiquinone/menaquinone biosynthesis C-methylase UbiE